MTGTRLCQVIALVKGAKGAAEGALTRSTSSLQKTGPSGPLAGITRTYKPRDENGEQLPPESTQVQVRVSDVITEVRTALTRLYDLGLTNDATNAVAVADVRVGDVVLATDVPVTYLLFLERQLTQLATFVAQLPVLDPAETWHYDETVDAYVTEPTQTVRSRKVPRNHVKAEATERHPAQVEVYTEDVPVGYWTTVKQSSALPRARVTELRERLRQLTDAVRTAREEANTTTVTDCRIGDDIFAYLLD